MLLFAIAAYAGPDGSGAFPGLAQLCEDTKLSERAVRYGLRKLEALGEIETIRHGGPQGVNRYRVTLVEAHSPSPAEKKVRKGGAKVAAAAPEARQSVPLGQSATEVGQEIAPPIRQPVAPDPSGDPSHDPPGEGEKYTPRAREAVGITPLSILKPGQKLAAEQDASPSWAALGDEEGGQPTPGPEYERRTTAWIDLQTWAKREGLGDAALAFEIRRRAERYRRKFTTPYSARALVSNWGALAKDELLAAAPVVSARASPAELLAAQPRRTRHNAGVAQRFLERHADEPDDIRGATYGLGGGYGPRPERPGDGALVAQVRAAGRGNVRGGD